MKLLPVLLVLAIAAVAIQARMQKEESQEIFDMAGFDDYEYEDEVPKKTKMDELISNRIQEETKIKSGNTKTEVTDDIHVEEEDTLPLVICDGTISEACTCELNEVKCDNILFEDDTLLDTLDVQLDASNEKLAGFKPYIARFGDNNITEIRRNRMPEGLEENLSALYLERNKITTIESHAFDGFKNISKIILTRNWLKTVRSDWFAGDMEKTLHVLDLSNNHITETEKSPFRLLKNLKKLVLDGNSLELNEDLFVGLDNLEELSLDDCGLDDKNIPKGLFKPLKKLKGLSLRSNKFTEVPEFLEELSHLQFLDLSETNIAELHRLSFTGQPEMVDIIFEHMPYLASVQDCAFCGLAKLRRVSFYNSTALTAIDENAFGFKEYADDRAAGLVALKLSRTSISKLPLNMLEYEKMENLDFGRMPLNCTCDQMFLKDVKTLNGASTNARCAYPKELNNKYIDQLDAEEMCGSPVARGYPHFFVLFCVISSVILVTVGCIIIMKRYRFRNIRNLPIPTLRGANNAYTNLDKQKENEFTESPTMASDGTPHFQPRPQMV